MTIKRRRVLAGTALGIAAPTLPSLPAYAGTIEETKKRGVILIFDEVVTGFRFAYGGAQTYYGVTPDLCTLGKIIGLMTAVFMGNVLTV